MGVRTASTITTSRPGFSLIWGGSSVSVSGLDYPALPDQPVNETLAVAGSGAIACGLAAAAAPHLEVTLLARSDQSAERALEHITEIAREGEHLENVNVTTELADVASATFAVEAISEHLDTKGALLAELDGVLGPETVLATTT